MRTVVGTGCWPGRVEGRVIWFEPAVPPDRSPVADRAAEVRRFRTALEQAVQDLEDWSDLQETVAARLLLQAYREALLEEAWSRRACSHIDAHGLLGSAAAVEVAAEVQPLLARSDALRDRAAVLPLAARWLASRLATPGPDYPADAILATATELSPGELLDLQVPVLLGGPDPIVRGIVPAVWGLPGIGPDWGGRRVAIDCLSVTLDVPDPHWWRLDGNRLNGVPLCDLAGDPDPLAALAAATRGGRKPAALVRRLDDLAAVPLWVGHVAAIAVDLDRMGRVSSLRHPGAELLIRAAAGAAAAAQVPFLAGGRAILTQVGHWRSLGFTGFFGTAAIPPEGAHVDAI